MYDMASYKAPDFKERVALADTARRKALEQLRTRPAPDEAAVAERQAARQAREAAAQEKSLARRAAEQQAKDAKRAEAAQAIEAAEAAEAARLAAIPVRAVRSAAELKADRDARYAARKSRRN